MRRKLTESEVREIIKLHRAKLGERNIARIIGKNEETVRNVLRGTTWRHITGGRLAKGRRKGVTNRSVIE